MSNQVQIEPFSFGPRGEATVFAVERFSGEIGNFVTFYCTVLDASGAVLDQPMQAVTIEQFNTWVNDAEFFGLLAELAGYTPVVAE